MSANKPLICLNMIVKNESKIIQRLLSSVLPFIDTYCICDTGSTDNTKELIREFFHTKQIDGKIVEEPFVNFEHNRTFALKACQGMSEFVLLLDADMVLEYPGGDDAIKKLRSKLPTVDMCHLFQGTANFYYKNVRIVRNDGQYSYWGVTHEVINSPPGAKVYLVPREEIFIHDIGDGGAKDDKYLRDIRLLTEGLKKEPNNDRYLFYLGNSYHDCGQFENAIETYKRRISVGCWEQEVWMSYYKIGSCYKNLGKMPDAIHWWMKGYQYMPSRLENIYEIIHYYRQEKEYQTAAVYCTLALESLRMFHTPPVVSSGSDATTMKYPLQSLDGSISYPNAWCYDSGNAANGHIFVSAEERQQWKESGYRPFKEMDDFLFLQKSVYSYKIFFEASIIGFYLDNDGYGRSAAKNLTEKTNALFSGKYDLVKMHQVLFHHPNVYEGMFNTVLSNYKYYRHGLINDFLSDGWQKVDLVSNSKEIQEATKDLLAKGFLPSTPSICWNDKEKGILDLNIRYVSYKIDEKGNYINQDQIISKNLVGKFDARTMKAIGPFRWLEHEHPEHDSKYVGLEDVRLMRRCSGLGHSEFTFSSNRGLNSAVDLPHGRRLAIEIGEFVEEGEADGKGDKGADGKGNADIISTKNSKILTLKRSDDSNNKPLAVEKNWVYVLGEDCPSLDNEYKDLMIYNWYPLEIGKVDKQSSELVIDSKYTIPKEKLTPLFGHIRGSTNGVLLEKEKEIWFLCHVVSHEDRRYYYHIFVVLDATTLKYKKCSKLFTFEKCAVEYSLGFVYEESKNEFYIAYSTMDNTSKIIRFGASVFGVGCTNSK